MQLNEMQLLSATSASNICRGLCFPALLITTCVICWVLRRTGSCPHLNRARAAGCRHLDACLRGNCAHTRTCSVTSQREHDMPRGYWLLSCSGMSSTEERFNPSCLPATPACRCSLTQGVSVRLDQRAADQARAPAARSARQGHCPPPRLAALALQGLRARQASPACLRRRGPPELPETLASLQTLERPETLEGLARPRRRRRRGSQVTLARPGRREPPATLAAQSPRFPARLAPPELMERLGKPQHMHWHEQIHGSAWHGCSSTGQHLQCPR